MKRNRAIRRLFFAAIGLLILMGLLSKPASASQTWRPGPVMVQEINECVGYSWAALLQAEPHPEWVSGDRIYRWAKSIDTSWPMGEGTSLEYAGTELLSKGYITHVEYTRDMSRVLWWLRNLGPVVVSVRWLSDMEFPETGIVHSTGTYSTNHAVMCYGDDRNYLLCQNSEGLSFGNRGYFKILISDLSSVLLDAALPVK